MARKFSSKSTVMIWLRSALMMSRWPHSCCRLKSLSESLLSNQSVFWCSMMFCCIRWRRGRCTILLHNLFHRSILSMRSQRIRAHLSTGSWRRYWSQTQTATRWPSSAMKTNSWCIWSRLLTIRSCLRMKRPCLSISSRFPSSKLSKDRFTQTKPNGLGHSYFHP